jgi:molybdopterin-binding protein
VYAEDVILCATRPGLVSARNVLPAVITALDRIGREFLVSLSIGEATLSARITPAAAEEMGLAVGGGLFVLIKTTACHHLSAEAR